MTNAAPRALRQPHRAARWLGRGGGALAVSAIVHAAAAVTLGGILGSVPRSPGQEPQTPDVDVALDVIAPGTSGQPGPPRAAAVRPTRRLSESRLAPPSSVLRVAEHEAPPARFALSAGTVATNLVPAAPSAATAPGERSAVGEGEVDAPARLIAAGPLAYPPAARQAAIEADLPLDIVVDAFGRVVWARAVSRAGYGLDEVALSAIRDYRFSPAMRDGRSVPVRMRWTVQFRLR